jgi:hypothetical protein
VFASSEDGDQTRKISFKIAESPEGGAITLGVANPALFKDRNFEINYGTRYDTQRVRQGYTACAPLVSSLRSCKVQLSHLLQGIPST